MDMYIGIATKLIIGAIGIFVVVRILGKKPMSELTPFDLIYVVLLGALVEESIYDDNINVLHVIFAIILWGIFVYVIEKLLERTDKISTMIEGEPAVLIDRGRLNRKELKDNHFDMEQLRIMLRMNGCYAINDCYYAILEVSGGLTVITKEEKEIPTFLLIEEGVIAEKTLAGVGKNESWLQAKLEDLGFNDLEDIIYCEWHAEKEELYVETYDNMINEKIYIDD